jgi:hypothetical protein
MVFAVGMDGARNRGEEEARRRKMRNERGRGE